MTIRTKTTELELFADFRSSYSEQKREAVVPVVGRCKLCLLDGVELRESHFIPKSAYKLVEKIGGVTPLSIRGSITLQKNEQLKAHLLCDACEGRFNLNGETWVLKYCNRPGTGFKLCDLVQKMQPETEEAKLKMYSMASIAEIDGEKLAYFVLSVLWRGSVHSWKWGKDHQRTGSLGSRYEEEFRKYLIGEAGFPETGRTPNYSSSRNFTRLRRLGLRHITVRSGPTRVLCLQRRAK